MCIRVCVFVCVYVCVQVCVRLYTEVCFVCQVCKRQVVCTEEPRSQKTPSVSVASTAGGEDICEETASHKDNHSGALDISEFNLSQAKEI